MSRRKKKEKIKTLMYLEIFWRSKEITSEGFLWCEVQRSCPPPRRNVDGVKLCLKAGDKRHKELRHGDEKKEDKGTQSSWETETCCWVLALPYNPVNPAPGADVLATYNQNHMRSFPRANICFLVFLRWH